MRVNFDDIDTDDWLRYTHNGEPFTGEIFETDRDGNVIELFAVRDGWAHGPERAFYPDGRLKLETMVVDSIAIGVSRHWYHNGQLAEERHFSDAGDLLEIRRWDEHGKLMPPDSYRSNDPATRYDQSPHHNPPDMPHPPIPHPSETAPQAPARELDTPRPEAEEDP